MAARASLASALLLATLLGGLGSARAQDCFYKLGASWGTAGFPQGVAIVASDNSIIATVTGGSPSVKRLTSQGVQLWSTPLTAQPLHIGVDSANDRVYVGDRSSIQVLTLSGTLLTPWPSPGAVGIAVAADGSLFVTTSSSGIVIHYAGNGTVLKQTGGFVNPWGVAVSPTIGDVFVSDPSVSAVKRLSASDFSVLKAFSVTGAPDGLAVDSSGNLLVSRVSASVVQLFSPDGALLCTLASSISPEDVAYSSAGFLALADTSNSRVVRFDGAPAAPVPSLAIPTPSRAFAAVSKPAAAATQPFAATTQPFAAISKAITSATSQAFTAAAPAPPSPLSPPATPAPPPALTAPAATPPPALTAPAPAPPPAPTAPAPAPPPAPTAPAPAPPPAPSTPKTVPTGAVELKDAKDQAERRGLRH
ncbi:hypothetical protein ABPG77_009333 [Micractinium sp. CCAP 211/92]